VTYPYGVSFVIPCWNEEANIADCLHAIYDEVRNYALRYEVIVVDNGCTDNTTVIAASTLRPLDKIVFEPRKGVVHARQAGADLAQYRYLANIDADNRIPLGWLKAALESMGPGVVAVSGPLVYSDVPSWVNIGARAFYVLARVAHHLVGPMIQGGNFVIRKSTLEEMGGYDTRFDFYGEDTCTAAKAQRFGKIKLVRAMHVSSSPRRLKGQGVLDTVFKYTLNYLSVSLRGHNVTKKYRDYR